MILIGQMSCIMIISLIHSNNNSNTLFQNFYNHITLCIDKHVPLRKLTRKEIKSVSKPWITPGIIESSKIKNNLYKKYLSTKDVYFLTKYKFYRNKISSLLRISKQQYYQIYFLENNKNIKNIGPE